MGSETAIAGEQVLPAMEGRRAQLAAELKRFVTVVSIQFRPQLIILFGSFAHGQVKEWSDLDLVVVAETELPFLQRLDLVFRRVVPTVGMDVLIYTPDEWEHLKCTRRFIQEEIVKKGTVIYEREGE